MTTPTPTEPPDLAALRADLARAWAEAARSKPDPHTDGRAYFDDEARHSRAVSEALAIAARVKAAEHAGRIERQKIGIARRQLGIPDDSHAARVYRISGGRTRTTVECTAAERRTILGEYRDLGFKAVNPKKAGRRAPAPKHLTRGQMLTRVEQLLVVLGKPWEYADSILRRQRGHDVPGRAAVAAPIQLATAEELRGVIAALDTRRKRLAREICANAWTDTETDTGTETETTP
jgi:phage gp16-like protein